MRIVAQVIRFHEPRRRLPRGFDGAYLIPNCKIVAEVSKQARGKELGEWLWWLMENIRERSCAKGAVIAWRTVN